MSGFRFIAVTAAMVAGAACFAPHAASAAPKPGLSPSIELSAQQKRRSRTRVTVFPRRQTALGPNAVRQCRAWLVQEFRPSGTVIVPRQQCWWEQ